MGLQRRLDAAALLQVRKPHDACGDPGVSVKSGGGHSRNTVHELHFTDRFHRLRAVGAVHGPAFDKDRRNDIVAGPQVTLQFVHQISAIDASFPVIPKVMMRVDNRQRRVEGFLLDLRQPGVVGGHVPPLHDRCPVAIHIDRCARNVGTGIGGQKARHVCKLFRFANTPHRYRLAHLLVELFQRLVRP